MICMYVYFIFWYLNEFNYDIWVKINKYQADCSAVKPSEILIPKTISITW